MQITHGAGFTGLLAADPYFDLFFGTPGPEYSGLHQPTHSFDVKHFEGIILQNTHAQVGRQKLLLCILAAEGENRLREIISAKGEKIDLPGPGGLLSYRRAQSPS